MNKDQIIQLWKSVGWNSAQDYHNDLITGDLPDDVIGNNLHPDNVNPKEFWKATADLFGTDPVANANVRNGIEFNIKESNVSNHLIPLFLGLLGSLEFAIFNAKRKFKSVRIAEIGCGYGSFKENFIDKRFDIDKYTGFDIIPRNNNTIEIGSFDGTFSEEQVEEYKEDFNIFYSSNVFQHLTENQIEKYLNQVYDMLPEGGYFLFTYVSKPNLGFTYHYGQRISILTEKEIVGKIQQSKFKLWMFHQQFNQNGILDPIGFCLEKKSLISSKEMLGTTVLN